MLDINEKNMEALQMLKEQMDQEVTNVKVEVKDIDVSKQIKQIKIEVNTNTNSYTNDKNIHSNIDKGVVIKDKINYIDMKDIKRGDVLYVDLDKNGVNSIGSEQKGIRYSICIQNDIGNKYSPTIIVALITSQLTKSRIPTHVEISAGQFGLPKDSIVMLEQVRTLDKKRIIKRVGTVDEIALKRIDMALDVSIKSLKPKNTLERLSKDIQENIINKINLIEDCKKSLDVLYKFKGDKNSIDFFEDKIFEEENSLQYYCDKKNIDYEEVYRNYIELMIKIKEDIAL